MFRKKIAAFVILLIALIFAHIYYAISPAYLPSQENIFIKYLQNLAYTFVKLKPDPFCNIRVPSSDVPIDIVIPIVEKDAESLIITIESIRCNVMQPIGNIYLIAPESKKIREIARTRKCKFILENLLLPKFTNQSSRKGWIKQQYLKLNADRVVENEHFLVIDADTLLVRPQIFVNKNKEILNILGDYWFIRKVMVKKALGFKKFHNLDFTSHHMLFSKSKLKAMKEHLEKLHKKAWFDALDSLDIPEGGFSEYELYANFVIQKFPTEVEIVWGRNSLFPRDRLQGVNISKDFLSTKYKSLTMHSFLTISGMRS